MWIIPRQIIFILSAPDTSNQKNCISQSTDIFQWPFFSHCNVLVLLINICKEKSIRRRGNALSPADCWHDISSVFVRLLVMNRFIRSTSFLPTKHLAIWTAVISQLSLVRNMFIISQKKKKKSHFSPIHLLHYYLSMHLEVLDQLM